MKIIDGHDVIEHAEVNGEDRAFIRKLTDYLEDADAVEPKTGDLIKREDAIRALAEVLYEEPPHLNSMEKRMEFARNAMKDIPTAEPKQGEWIEEIGDCEGKTVIYICSQCGDDDGWINYNYCPNCGCRMKGADDGEDIQSEAE